MFQHQIIASDRPEREEAYSYISDASKDAWGFRSRNADRLYMSLAELQAECDYWSDQVAITIREESKREAEAIAEFEATIQAVIKAGAADRATAVRWIRDAWAAENEWDCERDGYFNFCYHLPYDYDPATGLRSQSLL